MIRRSQSARFPTDAQNQRKKIADVLRDIEQTAGVSVEDVFPVLVEMWLAGLCAGKNAMLSELVDGYNYLSRIWHLRTSMVQVNPPRSDVNRGDELKNVLADLFVAATLYRAQSIKTDRREQWPRLWGHLAAHVLYTQKVLRGQTPPPPGILAGLSVEFMNDAAWVILVPYLLQMVNDHRFQLQGDQEVVFHHVRDAFKRMRL